MTVNAGYMLTVHGNEFPLVISLWFAVVNFANCMRAFVTTECVWRKTIPRHAKKNRMERNWEEVTITTAQNNSTNSSPGALHIIGRLALGPGIRYAIFFCH